MSNVRRSYTIRLSAEGARNLEADLKRVGRSGKSSFDLILHATRPASDGLKSVNRDVRTFRTQLQGVSREIPMLARYLGTTALAGGLIAFGRSSLQVAAEFQSAMKRVQASTGAGVVAIDRLQQKARDIGANTGFTATQAALAIEVLAKNGVDVSAILGGALDATVALSGALGSELAPSADLVTDLMAQFSLQAEQLPLIADRITGAALNSKFGFDDLRQAIGQAGGVAGKFGVDVEEFLTALSLTASGFSSGSDAGTSFKNFLQRLTPQSKQAASAMESIGFSAFDAQGKMKSLDEIAENLRQGIAGLSEEARNSTLQTIFGTDAIRTALLLADAGGAAFEDLKEKIADVSAADQAEIRLEGLQGALRELASAWEALQLAWAENGGLDIAEAAVDRLTDALRYLSENFTEVEEVIERVVQALTVYLVGRGLNYAAARAVAMRATWIELAGSVSGVGTAAVGTAGALTRLGIAGRALTGLLGGPVGLALTAASVIALGIDIDTVADAIDAAESATGRAKSALDKYAEASKKVGDEQEAMGGKVSAATQKIVEQSRVQLQTALRDSREALAALQENLTGDAGPRDSDDVGKAVTDITKAAFDAWNKREIGPRPNFNFYTQEFENLGPIFDRIVESLKAFEDGEKSVVDLYDELSSVAGIGEEVATIIGNLDDAMQDVGSDSLGDARDSMRNMAQAMGVFQDQLDAIDRAESELDLIKAYSDLRVAMQNAADAGAILRSYGEDGLLALLEPAANAQQQVEDLEQALLGTWESATEQPEKTFANQIEDDAKAAAEALRQMEQAFESYHQRTDLLKGSTDRGSWLRAANEVAGKGVRDLIGYAEGTDKGRGYNETLDYGRWTGGDVNLINMTLREVLDLQKQMLANPENRALYGDGKGSSAVGRYQIVSTTLKGLIDKLGLSLDEKFTPKLQDRMADELVRGRMGQGVSGMRNEWEGLRNVPAQTIQSALGAQVIPTMDPQVEREATAAAEQRRRVQDEQFQTMQRLIDSGNERAAQLELENSLINASEAEAARARYVFEALAEAKRGGIDVDTQLTESGETLRQVIMRKAEAIGLLIEKNEELKSAAPDAVAEAESARAALESSFESVRNGSASMGDALANVLDHMAKRLWDLALDPVFDVLSGAIGSFISGIGGNADGGAIGLSRGGSLGIPSYSTGGDFQFGGRAAGRLRGTGHTKQDNILFWGSRGEFMQPADAVDYYGLEFMEELRAKRIPRFADGGAVDAYSMPQGRLQTPGVGVGKSNAPAKLEVSMNVTGARGDKDIEQAGYRGMQRALNEFNRQVLPGRVAEIQNDPGKVG